MYLTLKFAFCLTLFLGALSRFVEVTCQANSGCEKGYAYHYENRAGTDFSCTDNCDNWKTTFFEVKVFDCEVDYLENKCESGVCFAQTKEKGVHVCSDAENQCPSYYYEIEVNATCSECLNIADCQTGLCIKTFGVESCYKFDECYFPWLGLNYSNCPHNATVKGENCLCCYHFYSESSIGICSNDVPYDSPELHQLSKKGEQKLKQDRKVRHIVNYYLSLPPGVFIPYPF